MNFCNFEFSKSLIFRLVVSKLVFFLQSNAHNFNGVTFIPLWWLESVQKRYPENCPKNKSCTRNRLAVEFLFSGTGKRKLLLNGYLYQKDKCEETIYWKCEYYRKVKCNAREKWHTLLIQEKSRKKVHVLYT